MSRIIVKNVPTFIDDKKLKEHFNKRLIEKYENSQNIDNLITDVKILRDKDGNSRKFAFIGYRNESDALDAIRYYDGSFIYTAKISVSEAKSFADPNVPRSMKEKKREALKRLREREEKLLTEKNAKKQKKQERRNSIDNEIEKNKQLQEFIETMKPSAKVASWEATSTNAVTEQEGEEVNPLLAHALAMKSDDENENDIASGDNSDDEYVDLNRNQNNEDNVQENGEQMMSLSDLNDGESNALAKDDAVSDLDWLKQRRVRIRDGEDKAVKKNKTETNEEKSIVEEGSQEIEETRSQEELNLEKIQETGRLFLRNILYTSTEDDFKALFGKFGELEEIHVALDTRTGQSKGFAYVLFKNPQDAVQAYIELDKQIFQGRLLHILPAESKKDHRLDDFDLKNMPLKKQRELKRKANASKSTFSWNALYMNQDAVLSSVAAKLGMEKSDLIDAESSGAAVKQALAEAHVINDVRKFFEEKGVNLLKFQDLKRPDQRDDRVILVKNFPYGTTTEEIGELFLPFGKIERLVMPPAGTIAIVQYRDITSARAAFTKLAFKRFKDGIIYLEKGPKDCFNKDAEVDASINKADAEAKEAKVAKPSSHDVMEGTTNEVSNESQDDVINGPTVSVFIKNLNFSTTSAQLNDKFSQFSGFVIAQVKTKPDSKHPGKTVSMGFGFVEFRTKEQANAVIAALDGTVIDGHKIQLKLSHRTTASNTTTTKKKGVKSGKIIVKNLPFEATRKDVFELFNSFGQLKSVRVPKKFDKSARGFAFVEFLLPKEAEAAMDQLQGVHLLGRRLVMQYAQQDAENAEEEIARMTKKVKRQAAANELSAIRQASGRKKLELEDENTDGLNGF
ncbi:hypothetical protein KAFR_0A05510 [Kazachstania africana CBS 2517]|uniref:Multiple RNA-binding domain-containing protein 1 n=1 Tax=Kazachstania africana (strain ATCC 22294 / BCRC 22015 / CBS 2517 / CECT 1963 / NBRC 1671 / NRRL Y-8276) TaxID=1071382 RepID=H2ANN6_KAZAF|nr:hypothetical protein KAFR_0A05510 [Kazachstania africana CBS 2517]CCF55986.1 hypothetical protein KAFR_0A05510 [Kazachstania africana CBS 2517]